MKSKRLMWISVLIMIIALSIAAGSYAYNIYLEWEMWDIQDEYWDDEIDKETYEEEMVSIGVKKFVSEILRFTATMLIYIGLFLAIVSVFVRLGEKNSDPTKSGTPLPMFLIPPIKATEVKEYEELS